jgi:O-antigen/teichoic acid export membrane protein
LNRAAAPDDAIHDSASVILKNYWAYCRPLAFLGVFTFLYRFVDRWLLQRYGGSIQQGYYSIAVQFSNLCLIATASVVKVFWKEIAEAYQKDQKERVYHLYAQVSKGLYGFAGWCCCLLIPYTREILHLTVGTAYIAGALTFALYLLYPIHNSLGQIQGTFLQAVGDTKNLTRVCFWTLVIGLPATYLVIADASAPIPGLGWGAAGLAFKTVLVQIFSIVWLAYVIARVNKWPFQEMYQVTILGYFVVLAWGCRYVVVFLFSNLHFSHILILEMLGGALLYVALTAVSIYNYPDLMGFRMDELLMAIKNLIHSVRSHLSKNNHASPLA